MSLVLWGGYVEEVWPDGDSASAERVRRGLLSLASRDALHCHRVVACRAGWTWTLVLTGPWRRSWGFQTRAGGWVPEEKLDPAVDC